MMKYYLSHSPARQNDNRRWFKSIKNTSSIGGKIIANAYGDNKDEAEQRAKEIAALPEMIQFIEYIIEQGIDGDSDVYEAKKLLQKIH